MFRIIKLLNNNSVLALRMEDQAEVIILGRGIGFGKKVNERIDDIGDAKVYELKKETEKGASHLLAQRIEPAYIELTGSILHEAEKRLGEIDAQILLPLADHIAFAVQRIAGGSHLPNPMTSDIQILFPEEAAVARYAGKQILEIFGVEFDEDELSYIALHLHSAIDSQKVTDVVKQTKLIHDCLYEIELRLEKELIRDSLSYNRLLNHMKFMIARMIKGEKIELDMNAYVEHQYPETFRFAEELCEKIMRETGLSCDIEEVGYLAIHIERVAAREKD